MENLKNILTIKPNEVTEDSIYDTFKSINESLFNDYCIIKGQYRYEFVELEYYFYCKNHQDLITYQRYAEPGDWYFHDSGLDICFQSRAALEFKTDKVLEGNDEMYFGGVLIRGLKRIDASGFHYFMGPQICCNELFNKFSAIPDEKNNNQYPYLSKKKHSETKLINCGRYFEFNKKTDAEKYISVGERKWDTPPKEWPVKEDTFKSLLKKKYRWFDEEKVDEWKKNKEGSSYSANLNVTYIHKDKGEK